MYLIDKQLNELLPRLNIVGESGADFSPIDQIQPCSIDLRLSGKFWKPFKLFLRLTVDLRKSTLHEMFPRIHWKEINLSNSESIRLRPREFLLARTSEEFTIPENHAGKIEGKSSFSRMGLSVHCTGDFINPGYRGHMTLQLYNYGPHTLRIYPYTPICQLMLVKLSDSPEHKYGDLSLSSKYMNDDGGPSYWWADRFIKKMNEFASTNNVSEVVKDRIINEFKEKDHRILLRLSKFLNSIRVDKLDNADQLISNFAQKEKIRKVTNTIFTWLVPAICLGMLIQTIRVIPEYCDHKMSFYFYLIIFILSLPGSLYLVARNSKYFELTN